MGVRGLPIEFATDASKSVRLETGAKLAKTHSNLRQRPQPPVRFLS